MKQYDADYSPESFGADDPITRAGVSTLPVQLSVLNLASLDLDLFSQADAGALALPTGLAAPVLADYLALLRYLLANPAQIRSLMITSSEASSAAPLLASMRVTPTRKTPFGGTASNEQLVRSYQTTQDFQGNRVTVPLSITIDSFSFINFKTDVNASGATVYFNLAILFGQRNEARRRIAPAAPLVMRPGSRGPASV